MPESAVAPEEEEKRLRDIPAIESSTITIT
jgi:hypothetical protein